MQAIIRLAIVNVFVAAIVGINAAHEATRVECPIQASQVESPTDGMLRYLDATYCA